MPTFQEIRQRKNDSVVQTFCDKRTLATLLNFFMKNRGYVVSTSELIRISLEYLELHIIEDSPECEVYSTEEANSMLKQQFKANLNPMRKLKLGGVKRPRYDYSFRRMMTEENAFVSGEDIVYTPKSMSQKIISKAKEDADKTALKVGTPEFEAAFNQGLQYSGLVPPEKREFRPNPDAVSSDEPPEHKAARWKEELQDMKSQLAAVPTDIITNLPVQEEDNADEQENEN